MERLGVSIVICCHNSARLLPKTLSHLKRQRVPDGLSWEVVIVDNASTDDTGRIARGCWAEGGPVCLRVIREPRLGLSYARERGFRRHVTKWLVSSTTTTGQPRSGLLW